MPGFLGPTTQPVALVPVQYRRVTLAGSDRLALAGAAEVFVSDFGTTASVLLGTPKSPAVSFTVPTDWFLDQIGRISLVGAMRATLQGTADLILTDDFAARSRIVLAGRS